MDEKLTIVMISMHTSPLAQPGQGDAGGMNVYIRNLTDALVRAGHQVLAFTRKTLRTDDTVILDEGTQSKVIPLPVGQLKLQKGALAELTEEFAEKLLSTVGDHARHPIVLHSHYWLSGLAAIHAATRLGSPVIHTMHTLGAAKNESAPGTEPAYRLEREAYISANANVLTANTVVEKHELIAHTGVLPGRVEVVHPGVDHRIFNSTGPRHWPGRTAAAPLRVLFAGRFQRFKGPHVLVRALAVLRDRGHRNLPVVHFTGAVSGSEEYDPRAQAHLLGVAQSCSFSAPVAPAVLASYMRGADVVAVPSVAESFGLVAVEAQACGTPVLAHRAGGLSTAVSHGVSGCLVDSLDPREWADVLETIMAEPTTWQARSIAGIQHAAGFSWTAMAQRMLEIYTSASRSSETTGGATRHG